MILVDLRDSPGFVSPDFWERVKRLRQILAEGFPVDLALDFLFTKNSTDLLILQNIKTAVEGRTNSVLHNATVVVSTP